MNMRGSLPGERLDQAHERSGDVQRNPRQGLRTIRLATATASLLGLVIAVGTLASASESAAAHVAAGVAIALLAGSLLEWHVHLHLCHQDRGVLRIIYQQHHLSHHRLGGAPIAKPLWMRMGEQFVGQFVAAALLIITPSLFVFGRPLLTASVALTSLSMSFAIAFFHHCYHGEVPRFPFARSRWFQFLRSQHLRHHGDLSVNLNVVFPVADLCVGTFSTATGCTRRAARLRSD